MSNLLLWEQSQTYLSTVEEIKRELKGQMDVNNKLKLSTRQLTTNNQNLSEQLEVLNNQHHKVDEKNSHQNHRIKQLQQDLYNVKNQRDMLESQVQVLKKHAQIGQVDRTALAERDHVKEQLTQLLEMTLNRYLEFIIICGKHKLPSYLQQVESLQPQLQVGLQVLKTKLDSDCVRKLHSIVDYSLNQIFQEFSQLVTSTSNLKMDNKINYQKICYLECMNMDKQDKNSHLKDITNEKIQMRLELSILKDRLLERPETQTPSNYQHLVQLMMKVCDNIPQVEIRQCLNKILIRVEELQGQNLLKDDDIQQIIQELRVNTLASPKQQQQKKPTLYLSTLSTPTHIDQSVKLSYQHSPQANEILQKESDKDSFLMKSLFSSIKRRHY